MGDGDRLTINYMVLGPVQTNCYIVRGCDEHSAIVIDPGDEGQRICDTLDRAGITVSAVLLTHGHFDHIGAVEKLRERYGARVYAPRSEQQLLTDAHLNLSCDSMQSWCIEADVWLEDGQQLSLEGLCLRVIETPGHTSGSVCYYLPDENVLFSGDTLFAGSVGRTDLPTGSSDTLMNSLHQKLMELPDETAVFPGHGPSTDLRTEKRSNPWLR